LSELGKTVTKHGVHIIGQPNIPATVSTDSSALYARNVLDFLKLVIDQDSNFTLPADDDIVTACLLCTGGEIKRKN
jgi:NAD(P) transhydrogenase subunit alpha